ncbi:MAG TPA: cytochrome C biogenesis protein CcdA [Elusimicrobia bacterium]|nr:cytochrome C biogenesis protein CcdA [Elusimicrobiota bacterium]HBT62455.1 cytochrome C biogenesis protein CcdA [Elusimicrobiota bacterium]
MPPTPQFRVLFVTAPDAKTAEDIASGLVERKLAACVNVLPGLTSVYRWEGNIHKDPEVLLIIKTRAGIFKETTQFIREKHPAKVPEIISLPISEGSPAYMQWLGANTLFAKAPEGI